MNKSKKFVKPLVILSVLLLLFGVTYSFFNYTRTGSSNTIRVGRISFSTRQTKTINLSNAFPIASSEIDNDTDNVDELTITIKGDTDYVGGIEYLISSVDTNIYTSTGAQVPVSLDVSVTGLGTENNNYFTARDNTNSSIYKQLVGNTLVGDQMLLVGYIVPNTTSGNIEGIDGSITIKGYFDKDKILISDTYDGTESDNMGTTNEWAEGKTVLNTTEWNSIATNGVSFKVKVEANEGIWVNGSLEEIMKVQNLGIDTEQGVDFSKTSEQDNTLGVYTRAGTQNDTYPIMYYRGAVEDNNVLFNNKCWKTVRTTDTGGVKLIYNGELSTNKKELTSEDYGTPVTNTGNFTYDSTDNTWNATITSSNAVILSFNIPVEGNYRMIIKGTRGSGNVLVLKDGIPLDAVSGPPGVTIISVYNYGALTTSNTIGVRTSGSAQYPCVLKVKVEYEDSTLGTGCNNMGTETGITINNTNNFVFNTVSNSIAYFGYMYGDVYEYNSGVVSGAYYDSTFIWDETNYKLTDSATTTKSNNAHYSCGETSKTATCTSLRYYYYGNYYILLTGGDGVEQAIVKMQTNTNDSNVKDKIDTWYESQMNTVTNKLEDTIWCNDRSFGDGNNNGWIANGGSLSTPLYYGAKERSNGAQNTSTVKNQPSLACANKNDAFTWKNNSGNRALDYPVGMLTADEVVLAGERISLESYSYLSSGNVYWFMSPYGLSTEQIAYGFGMIGSFLDAPNLTSEGNIRPSVSIKPGQLIIKGTGTVTDPYIIE